MKRIFSLLMACFMLLAFIPVVSATQDDNFALFGFADMQMSNGAGEISTPRSFVGFNSTSPAAMQSFSGISNRISCAAESIDNVVYAYAHAYSDEDLTSESFYSINTQTWTATSLGTLDINYQVMDMTYAADIDTMYALVFDVSEADYHIMSVNLANGQLTDYFNLTSLDISITTAIAYIGDGRFFSTTRHLGNGIIFSSNGISDEFYATVNENIEAPTAMTYYAPENCIYTVVLRTLPAGSFGILMKIDLTTGVAEELGTVGGGYGYSLTSLFLLPDYEIEIPETPSQEDFDAAINADGSSLTFINDFVSPWSIGTEGSRTYVQSETASKDGSATTITAIFNDLDAGQVLSFDWMVSSENNYDWLSFYSNGTRINQISGTTAWATQRYTIPTSGNYTFEWTYSKDSSVASGLDAGRIDNVILTGDQPEPYDPTLLMSALSDALNIENGDLMFVNDLAYPWTVDDTENGRISVKSTIKSTANGKQTVYTMIDNANAGDAIRFDWKSSCEVGDRLVFYCNTAVACDITGVNDWEQYTFIIPESGSYVFSWQYARNCEDLSSTYDDTVWFDNVEYIHDYEPDEPINPEMPDPEDFNAAVNANGQALQFVNDNAHPWQLATDGNRTCVVSDIMGLNNVESAFVTDLGYVDAGTTVTFDWKTSCEEYADRVCFTMNGMSIIVASGITGWTTVTYTIEYAGEYVIGFKYEKDGFNSESLDCVWVDNVIVAPPSDDDEYTVTFVDGLTNAIIDTQVVLAGEDALPPTPPTHDGYTFSGWEGDYTNVTSDRTITAIYVADGLNGDVNGDGRVTAADALLALRHAVGAMELTDEQQARADMNGDGIITAADAMLIIRMSIEAR